MHPATLWYLTRASGVVMLLLLTTVVLLGVTSTFRWQSTRLPKFLVHGLHRNVTLLSLVFLGIHVVTAVADSYAPIRIVDVLVPFVGTYRPLWLGLGAVAFDLLLALVITSLLRARIGRRLWRGLHWLAYAAWPVAVVHGLGTGTDARAGWMELLTAACTVAVAGAVLFRVSGEASRRPALRLSVGAAALLLPVLGVVWAQSGPLHSGWAKRAGTPAALLGGGTQLVAASSSAAQTTQAVVRQPTLSSPPYRQSFTGRLTTSQSSSGLVHVSIDAVATGSPTRNVLHVDLFGEPLDGGGVAMTASRVTFGPASAPRAYGGHIVALDGSRLAITLQTAAGDGMDLAVNLQINGSAVTGVLRAEAAGSGFGGSE
ncbi:MAG: hypothetical protein ACXVZ4_13420 [Gaiellaceae bacterium]